MCFCLFQYFQTCLISDYLFIIFQTHDSLSATITININHPRIFAVRRYSWNEANRKYLVLNRKYLIWTLMSQNGWSSREFFFGEKLLEKWLHENSATKCKNQYLTGQSKVSISPWKFDPKDIFFQIFGPTFFRIHGPGLKDFELNEPTRTVRVGPGRAKKFLVCVCSVIHKNIMVLKTP